MTLTTFLIIGARICPKGGETATISEAVPMVDACKDALELSSHGSMDLSCNDGSFSVLYGRTSRHGQLLLQ